MGTAAWARGAGIQRRSLVASLVVLAGGVLVLAGPGPVSAASDYALVAGVSHVQYAVVPAPPGPGVSISQAVGASDLRTGYQGWGIALVNTQGLDVPDPAITVSSGWDPSVFPGLTSPTTACPSTVTRQGNGFPYAWTEPTLAGLPGSSMDCDTLASLPGLPANENGPQTSSMIVQDLWQGNWGLGDPNAPVSFQPGYDSFRSVDTTTIAPGGTQHVTAGLTVRDASIVEIYARFVAFMSPETFISAAPPAGVPECPVPDPGTAACLVNPPSVDPGGNKALFVDIRHPVPGHEYDFSVTAINTGSAQVDIIPGLDTFAMPQDASVTAVGPSVQVTEPGLDGATPGSGNVTFSIGAGQAADWTVQTSESKWVFYPGYVQAANPPTSTSQCTHDGWADYTDGTGQPFKNQGDCVSYVATGGKNSAG